MNNSGVKVSRIQDNQALRALFGQDNKPETRDGFVWDDPWGKNLGADEPESYIAVPGKPTNRGSRTVRNTPEQPNAEPDGTPAWMAERKLGGPGGVIKKTNNIVDMVNTNSLSQPIEPPTQENSIPEEYKSMMFKDPRQLSPNMNPQNPTVIRDPRQFPTEDIPSCKPDPDPYFPGPNVLPPTKQPMIQPTEDMIIKVLGYNETNMKLLGQVSDNIARCTKVLGEINNETHPVDMNSLMNALSFMDATTFRKVLADAFEATLKKNIELSTLISSYINGTAKIEDPSTSSSETTGGGTKTDGTFQGGASADTGSQSEQTGTTPTTPSTSTSESSEKPATENPTVTDTTAKDTPAGSTSTPTNG
jgi:hypothetical protein